MKLICLGNTISGWVNGSEVVSAQDGTYHSGLMALGVGKDNGVPALEEARFANLVLYKIVSGH